MKIEQNTLTEKQAVALLHTYPYDALSGWVYESHKDFYGTKGHFYYKAPREQLVSWILSHFFWNEETQCWDNQVPFVED